LTHRAWHGSHYIKGMAGATLYAARPAIAQHGGARRACPGGQCRGERAMTNETNAAPGLSLTIVDVCDRLNRRLSWYGLPQLRTGMVMEANDDTIVAYLTDQRDVQRVELAFDRHTGRVAPSVAPAHRREPPIARPPRGPGAEPRVALAVNG
jgi:hypothetical protein